MKLVALVLCLLVVGAYSLQLLCYKCEDCNHVEDYTKSSLCAHGEFCLTANSTKGVVNRRCTNSVLLGPCKFFEQIGDACACDKDKCNNKDFRSDGRGGEGGSATKEKNGANGLTGSLFGSIFTLTVLFQFIYSITIFI